MILKCIKNLFNTESGHEEDRDSSLRGLAMQRARQLRSPRAGTPHDWEDWERYQQKMSELES